MRTPLLYITTKYELIKMLSDFRSDIKVRCTYDVIKVTINNPALYAKRSPNEWQGTSFS